MYDPDSGQDRCQCREGGFGPTCEFSNPCLSVRTSGADAAAVDLDVSWNLVTFGNSSDPETLRKPEKFYIEYAKAVSTSLRPVYVARTGVGVQVLFHNGRRWLMVKTQDLSASLGANPNDDNINDFMNKLQFFNEYSTGENHPIVRFNDLAVAFSEPSSSASPEDVIQWIRGELPIKLQMSCETPDPLAQKFLDEDKNLDLISAGAA